MPRFGMPSPTLWGLVLLAAGFIVYSLTCWRRRAPLRPWLPVVMVANLTHSVVLAAALVVHASAMTRRNNETVHRDVRVDSSHALTL